MQWFWFLSDIRQIILCNWRLFFPLHITPHHTSLLVEIFALSCPASNLHSYTSSKSPHPKALGWTFPADIKLKPPALLSHPPWNAPAHRWRSLLVPSDETSFQRCSLSMLKHRWWNNQQTTLITAESDAKNEKQSMPIDWNIPAFFYQLLSCCLLDHSYKHKISPNIYWFVLFSGFCRFY